MIMLLTLFQHHLLLRIVNGASMTVAMLPIAEGTKLSNQSPLPRFRQKKNVDRGAQASSINVLGPLD